jgi:stress-induced morphogen
MSLMVKLMTMGLSRASLFIRYSTIGQRFISNERKLSPGESELVDILKVKFPNANKIDVVDISGGCGSMYEVYLETTQFRNIRTVRQHQLVNEALKDKVKNMHGIRIFTSIPE